MSRADHPVALDNLSDLDDRTLDPLAPEVYDFLDAEHANVTKAVEDLAEVFVSLRSNPDFSASLPLLQAQYDLLRATIETVQEEQTRIYKDFVALADTIPHKKVDGLYTRVQPKPSETLNKRKLLQYVPVEVLEECTDRKPVTAYYKIAPVGSGGEEE